MNSQKENAQFCHQRGQQVHIYFKIYLFTAYYGYKNLVIEKFVILVLKAAYISGGNCRLDWQIQYASQKSCVLLNIRKTRTTQTQSDGKMKELYATLETNLKMSVNEHQIRWDYHILLFILTYSSSFYETLGSIVLGRRRKSKVWLTLHVN